MALKKTLVLTVVLIGLIAVVAVIGLWLMVSMPGESYRGPLPALSESERGIAKDLKRHVIELADVIGERHAGVPDAYHRAGDYIMQSFITAGLAPYSEDYGDKQQYRNIVAEHYGTDPDSEIIIIGAHYDTVWLSPGADDNASGIAVMLELAKQIRQLSLKKQVRFIAFANEESPYFFTKDMGSLFHARRSFERGEHIAAMFSLEMLGYFSDEAGSQYYPAPLDLFYPDTANFIVFVSNLTSRSLLTRALQAFRENATIPSEGFSAPAALVPDVRRSDHAAFWRYGVKAVMITDTASYRNLAYHNVSDVPESLNYDNMARITSGLVEMIKALANED